MIITADYETYWSSEFSLSKMSEVEYILDPRFQVIMLGLKVDCGPTETFVGHAAVARRLAEIEWNKTAWLSHNTRFDGAILAWIFGYRPKMYLDTLSMARATTHWHIGRSSLAALSTFLKLPAKGDEVVQAKGLRLEDFSSEQLEAYRRYCARDTDNCRAIFDALRPYFAASELALIDVVVRMFVNPQVRLNADVLTEHLAEVREQKARVLATVDVEKSVLSSNQQFAALLESYGVEVPMKPSPTNPEQTIPALARDDAAFKELCADLSLPVEVQALLAARLEAKSTIEETRTAKLLKLAGLRQGWAPVPLKYSGARTHRLSGDDGFNFQNLPRGSLIHEAVEAPPGMRIVHRDSSQIEARMVAWMAECHTLLTAFREGRDVYSEFATQVYERPITRDDKLERFVGKTSILGLGYGCGAVRFRNMLLIGNGGISLKIPLEQAAGIVDLYRDTYQEIRSLWQRVEGMLRWQVKARLRRQDRVAYNEDIPAVLVGHDTLWLPNDMCISYPRLHGSSDENGKLEIQYWMPNTVGEVGKGSWRKLYGAKCVENISQALARIVVTDIAVRTKQESGYTPFLSTHDSLDYCVPDIDAEAMDAYLEHQFSLAPSWAATLPLASEGGWGRTLRAAVAAENG